MGNGSYDHHHPHHLHQQNFHHRNPNSTINPTNTFLPMLCRVSIKDAVNHPRRICPKKDDPSSPKVSCIGQVKKHHNTTTTNKLINPIPTPFTAAVSATKSAANAKHSKLKKIFSGKNLLTTSTAASTTSCRTSTSKETIDRRRPPSYITARSEIHHHGHDNSAAVGHLNLNLAELDPPLPVVKRVAKPCGAGEDVVSLWQRRSGGAGLKGLQIQPFQLQNNNNRTSHFLSPTTV